MSAAFQIRDAIISDAPALADCVIKPIITSFHGRVPEQCLNWLTRMESISNWQRWFAEHEPNQFLLVAEKAEAGVVGVALGGPQPDDVEYAAELYLLGVLPAYQRQGIGRTLVRSVASRFQRQGQRAMRVMVLAANPNRSFYEALGAHFLCEQSYDWNGVVLPASLYGWRDTSVLCAAEDG